MRLTISCERKQLTQELKFLFLLPTCLIMCQDANYIGSIIFRLSLFILQSQKYFSSQQYVTMQPQEEQPQSFILEDYKVLKIKVPLQKVLGFCPMFNNTFVVLGIKTMSYECVVHYDSEGNVLKELVFHDSNLSPYAISSDREIIWVDNDRDLILQWNLETYELLEFPFEYKNDGADSHEVFIFPETKLICIAERGRHDSNFLRYTYYNYPLTKDSKEVYVYENSDVWNYEYTIRRANIKSKFIWWKCAMKESIEFRTFQIFQKDGKWEGEYLEHKVANPFKTGTDPTELSVGCLWEMTPKKYLIVSICDRPHTETDYPNALFVYEENSKLFREANFAFEGKFRFQYIHYFSFGKTAMIRSFDFIKGEAQETPVYFIDNENECIAARKPWKCSHLNKFSFPAYDGNLIIDAEYENGDVDRIVSRAIKIVGINELVVNKTDPKEIVADILVQIVKDIDDDLLKDVATLIELTK